MSWVANRQHNAQPRRKFGPITEELPPQKLPNGAVRTDFHTLSKPPNLSNSAVQKMLEEEEQHKRPSYVRKVIWPPPRYPGEYEKYEEPVTNYHPNTYVSGNGYIYNNIESSQPSYRPVHYSPSPPPPPSTITLRESAPINQISPPVVISQPATTTIKGGTRNKGNEKWPPENYKQQQSAKAENEARIALAKGPVFRPRRVDRYSAFVAQNAIPTSYRGYRPPPGTQHHQEIHETNFCYK